MLLTSAAMFTRMRGLAPFWASAALVVGLGSCSGQPNVALPTPGPSSLLTFSGEATFRLLGTVSDVRFSSGEVKIDAAGYPSAGGTITIGKVEQLETSAMCDALPRTTILYFGSRWLATDRSPDPTSLGTVPTRFGLPDGAVLRTSLEGKRVRMWGAIPASTARCDTLPIQYAELANA